jgi:uncharacterized protein (TIGR03437 family)
VLLAAVAPLAAQTLACSYSLNQTVFVLPGSSTQPISGTIAVTVTAATGQTCTWSLSTTAPWINLVSSTITGTGSVTFTLYTNSGPSLRQDVITFSAPGVTTAPTIAVYQMAATCAYTLSATSTNVKVGGASGTLQVTTGCSWVATTNQTWLTTVLDSGNLTFSSNPSAVNSGATNYGNGIVDYTVAPNGCVASRSASLTIVTSVTGAQQALAIAQDGSTSNLTLSPATLTTSASAATGAIRVSTGDGCAWSATSNAGWLTIAGSSSGSGLGSITYNIQANPGPARTGSIQVGPQTFTVTQQGFQPPTPQVTSVLNGASYASGAISPGEIVTLFGSNLGPAQGVPFQLSADGKSIPNTLGGVQVLFGSTAATLLYVSAAQINAIVPYAVAGTASTALQVQYQGQTSTAMTVAVQAATPGIFSQDATGTGPGAIFNQDGSLNASLSPAAAGSVIQIYATGGGITTPAQTDGVLAPLAPPLPLLAALPVSVTIGGFGAKVDYAGVAPGEVAGMIQINAEVPAVVAPGLSVPVVVQIGNWQSQTLPALTITVR